VPSTLAIVFFVGGSFAGALLVHSAVRQIRRLVFGMVASSLVLIISFTRLDIVSDGVGIAVISFAMGATNTALPRVGAQSVSLTFVTGTLTGIAVHLALAVRHAPLPDSQGSWDTHQHRARLWRALGRAPRWRIVVGGDNTSLRRVGFVVTHACPIDARGVRSFFERIA
jgi:uncharacterized membrane protein YoaK (UPF0700 family)